MNFNIDLASQLVNSNESFPVDFDKAWQWLGYFDKPTAKRSLLSCGFQEGIDLRIDAALGTLDVPRSKECITLSVDCFKTWGMLAGTEQGKQVRRYFIECERQLKARNVIPQLTNIEKAEASCRLVDVIFSGVPLKPELIAGVKINMTEQLAPELAGCFDYARQLLIGNTAQELELLTVTKLGALLNLSAVATNKKLIEAGLQVKNDKKRSKKDSSYLPTGQGLEFSDLTLATGTGKDNTTYQQLRWYPSVLELLS